MPIPFRFPENYSARPFAVSGTKLLDGLFYGFQFLPNVRVDAGRGGYFVDLFDARNRPVIYGVKLALSDDLFGRFRATVLNVPPGRVVVRRTDGIDSDPAIFDVSVPDQPRRLQTLGSPAVVVEYVTLAEIAAGA
jgi:hypothetical protein